jgi:cation transport ATPase
MIRLLPFFAFIFLIFSCSDTEKNKNFSGKSEEITLAIEGMVCEFGCAKTIEKELKKSEGIIDCKVNFQQNQATCKFDPEQTSAEEIVNIINNINNGTYKAKLIEKKTASPSVKNSNKQSDNLTGHKISQAETNWHHIISGVFTFIISKILN